MKYRLTQIFKVVRNFLFSSVNKEFLIFLFFLFLSSIFWLMMALNETYEQEIKVPVRLVNVPKNVVLTTEMEDTVRVTVRDKGFTLATYMYGDMIQPVSVNFSVYANRQTGYGYVPASDLLKMLSQRFMAQSKIIQVKPDRLDFYFNYGVSKQLPVRMAGYVVPGKSYYLARTRFWPDQITEYASKRVLDSLRFVKTVPLNIVNFGDTVIQTVALEKIKGVKMVPDRVRIGLYPDIMTEESIDVPVGSINMPEGKVLRTFPSRVKVNFIVGASMFRNITADQFQVVVDYNELMEHPSDKCNIYLKASPHSVRSAKLSISQVDYLIEQQ